MMASDVPLTTIPEQLKRLVRLIVRGFYSVEHAVVIDMLVRHPCVKEDDLAELLKFERRHLRSVLNVLKLDKFLKSRMRVETDEEGRTTRHTFYFINYSVFVNVVKYKLDHMRRKIEADERDNTSRSTFKCMGCEKTYTDLEVGQLFDIGSNQLICTYCHGTVEEDESSVPKQNVRTMLARFNEQIETIYDLLRECEDLKLAPEVLDPEPTDMKRVMNRGSAGTGQKVQQDDGTAWSGYATRKVDFGYSENRVTITMDDENAGKVEKKDQPVWMTTSTVDGSTAVEVLNHEIKVSDHDKRGRTGVTDDILQTLLVHEPKAGPSRAVLPENSDGDSDTEKLQNGEDVEEMDSDEFEDVGPMVSIGSSRVPYNSITSEMVAAMTPLEKEEYIRIGQQLYENIYE